MMRLDDKTETGMPRMTASGSYPARNILGTALAVVAGAAMLAMGFVFVLVMIAVIMIAGVIGYGYLRWKTRALNRQMRAHFEQAGATMDRMAQGPAGKVDEGDVIEGVVISRDSEKRN